MIKAINKGGSVLLQTSGETLDQAQEFLAIRQFIKQHPEVECMADFIEMFSCAEEMKFENQDELLKAHEEFSNTDHKTTTEEKIKELLRKKMN